MSSEELEKAIISYNLKYEGTWQFHLLHSFFNEVGILFFKHYNGHGFNFLINLIYVGIHIINKKCIKFVTIFIKQSKIRNRSRNRKIRDLI